MKTCLFCRNIRIFNIHNDYGNSNHTAKDDMLQFFGDQIEEHLRPDDAICNLCMNIMDNVAKLKKRLLPLIFRTESTMEDCKPIAFLKKWDALSSMNFDEDNEFLQSRSPTPSSLLKCIRVVPYQRDREMKIAEIERHRSLSRSSYARSDGDSEIEKAFSKRRGRKRKRGHNWTRRKNGRYSRSSSYSRRSVNSSYSSKTYTVRPVSVMSSESYESFYPPGLESSSPVTVTSETSLRYLDGCLQNKRTRSVAKRQEEEIRMYFKETELHQCPQPGCSFICEDIDLMAKHKTDKHKELALFWCNFCGKKYTTSGDLEVHKRTHNEQYSCVICHKEFYYDRDLLEHWQEHVKKSVPCRYCGKRFVDKNICNKHQKNVHKKKAPSRVDYDKDVEQTSTEDKDFEVRIMVQDVTPLEV